jgi:UDP-2,4-diacetamido-2,4,6-trideoxy-beta-L-altropyranose hydrolase
VVFDHFRIEAEDHRRAARGRVSLAIDDMADRPLDVDLNVDLGPDRRVEDYAGLLPARTRLLLGPAHALVRPEFGRRREAALARRSGPVRRILVSLGLTDVGGVTGRVVRSLLALHTDAEVTAVVGREAPSLPLLRANADARLEVVVEAKDMDRLTEEADLAVGAGGSTTWERCTLGLPTLLLILADNQAPSARALERLGAAVVLDVADDGFEDAFSAAAAALLSDEPRRRSLSAASAALCDGQGAGRVAEAFLETAAYARS